MIDITKDLVNKKGTIMVSSLKVAEYFEKEHRDVLRAIEKIECSQEFRERNFALSSYKSQQNKRMPCIEMTKDGFAMLAMGFTGSRATAWKEKFLEAFNLMEQALRSQGTGNEWIQARRDGIINRKDETGVIQRFVDYAKSQGSKNADKYYMNLTRMENKGLFIVEGEFANLREALNIIQLNHIATADYVVMKALEDGMERQMYYKDIYKLAKERVETFATTIGITKVNEQTRLFTHVEARKARALERKKVAQLA